MPKLPPNALPALRLHKQSGQGIVTLNGRDFLLGPYGSPQAAEKYDRLIAEWIANGRQLKAAPRSDTIDVVIAAYWAHCLTWYPHAGRGEPPSIRKALGFLRRLYGHTQAAAFGPLALKAVRESMVEAGLSRKYVNRQVARIVRMFKWAVENERCGGDVLHALQAVAGLKRGRTAAPETNPVRPVPEAMVKQVLPFMPPPVSAMVRLELLTGARGGELCALRGAELDRSGAVWLYRPSTHKSSHHGKDREIRFGPRAQQILLPFLKLDPEAYTFSPAEAEADRRAKLHQERKTPLGQGNRPGTNRKEDPKRVPGDRYTGASYYHAIMRACDRAFPPPPDLATPTAATAEQRATAAAALKAWRKAHRFHPHQLRHSAGTRIRREFGAEAAQIILGHSSLETTELYAEADRQIGDRVMGQIG